MQVRLCDCTAFIKNRTNKISFVNFQPKLSFLALIKHSFIFVSCTSTAVDCCNELHCCLITQALFLIIHFFNFLTSVFSDLNHSQDAFLIYKPRISFKVIIHIASYSKLIQHLLYCLKPQYSEVLTKQLHGCYLELIVFDSWIYMCNTLLCLRIYCYYVGLIVMHFDWLVIGQRLSVL